MLVVTYALALWLGLYLLRHGTYAVGIGLTSYAIGLALMNVPGWWIATALIPAVCWLLAVWQMWAHARQTKRKERWLLLVASIFLALSVDHCCCHGSPRCGSGSRRPRFAAGGIRGSGPAC